QNEEFQSIHFAAYGKDVVYGLARKFAAAASTGWLLITAGDGSFALVSAEASENLGAFGQELAKILDGRGGGRGQIYQGKANAAGRYQQAEKRLRGMMMGESQQN
ncbi:MAG: hypothetical protein GY906_39590, partial [bacterium]|nr:hypothetical protein [bacterium]